MQHHVCFNARQATAHENAKGLGVAVSHIAIAPTQGEPTQTNRDC